jgi:hypothetical protein
VNEAKNIENVFVNASGLNNRPSCASSENTGMKLTVMTQSEEQRAVDAFGGGDDDFDTLCVR